MSDFSAIYLPSLEDGEADPSRSGFSSQEEAEDYVFSKMCIGCNCQRQMFMEGKQNTGDPSVEQPNSWPACACEWIVAPTDKAETADELGTLLAAGGYTKIYERPK